MSKHIVLALLIATIGIIGALWLYNAQNQPMKACENDSYGLNAYRQNHGLPCLVEDAALTRAAQQRSAMIEAGEVRFSHEGYEAIVYRNLGYKPGVIAENLSDNVSQDKLMRYWNDSPAHKKNLTGRYTHYGLSCTGDVCALELRN